MRKLNNILFLNLKMARNSLGVIFVFYSLTVSRGRHIRSADCDIVCPREENPVCARCGDVLRSFSHPCFIRRELQCYDNRCAIQNHGMCIEDADDCETDCTRFPFEPFCAQDGDSFMTFSNACQLEKQNKCARRNYQKISEAPCYQRRREEKNI